MKTRRDLSAWVMHFVHQRNPENDPCYNLNEGEATPLFPFHEDRDKNLRFESWNSVEDASCLAADDDAFRVLLKIIDEGHIRSGWSFRGGKPTIYGPRAATCFTEMPLYALIDYAQKRAKDSVDTYAIGLLRNELFAAGGRPVIYGLSGPHVEQKQARRALGFFFDHWPRKLAPSCGIAEHEQYRYVAMQLEGAKRIDWGHEREWRWADVADSCSCPGLPIWLKDEPHQFSRVMIVVPSQEEGTQLLDKLKELYDAGTHNFGYEYDQETLAATRVVALDTISNGISADKLLTMRLEDIPTSSIKTFTSHPTTPEFKAHVTRVLEKAHAAAAKSVVEFADDDGACGFAHLVLYSPQSELATALQELDEATVIGGVGYWISNFGGYGAPSIRAEKVAVSAALEVMKNAFPNERFGTTSNLD